MLYKFLLILHSSSRYQILDLFDGTKYPLFKTLNSAIFLNPRLASPSSTTSILIYLYLKTLRAFLGRHLRCCLILDTLCYLYHNLNWTQACELEAFAKVEFIAPRLHNLLYSKFTISCQLLSPDLGHIPELSKLMYLIPNRLYDILP